MSRDPVETDQACAKPGTGELGPDLGLGLAGDFLAPPLAVRAGLEADHATPAARTMPAVLRVAALP
jgi:hypothetical protein